MSTVAPPPTLNYLPHAQRTRLLHSTRKLEALLGATPRLLEQHEQQHATYPYPSLAQPSLLSIPYHIQSQGYAHTQHARTRSTPHPFAAAAAPLSASAVSLSRSSLDSRSSSEETYESDQHHYQRRPAPAYYHSSSSSLGLPLLGASKRRLALRHATPALTVDTPAVSSPGARLTRRSSDRQPSSATRTHRPPPLLLALAPPPVVLPALTSARLDDDDDDDDDDDIEKDSLFFDDDDDDDKKQEESPLTPIPLSSSSAPPSPRSPTRALHQKQQPQQPPWQNWCQPRPPKPLTSKERRDKMAKLTRHLGAGVPPELVFPHLAASKDQHPSTADEKKHWRGRPRASSTPTSPTMPRVSMETVHHADPVPPPVVFLPPARSSSVRHSNKSSGSSSSANTAEAGKAKAGAAPPPRLLRRMSSTRRLRGSFVGQGEAADAGTTAVRDDVARGTGTAAVASPTVTTSTTTTTTVARSASMTSPTAEHHVRGTHGGAHGRRVRRLSAPGVHPRLKSVRSGVIGGGGGVVPPVTWVTTGCGYTPVSGGAKLRLMEEEQRPPSWRGEWNVGDMRKVQAALRKL